MKKRCFKNKKGLSPVIATVLLIVLVLVLFALIFLWMKGFFKEQIEKNEQAIENICPSVNFESELTTENYLETINRGGVHIYDLEIKIVGEKGNEKIYDKGDDDDGTKLRFHVEVSTSRRDQISLIIEGDTAEKIIVYPVLLGSVKAGAENRPYTCLNQGRTINI